LTKINPKSIANLVPLVKGTARAKAMAKKAGLANTPAKRIATRLNSWKKEGKLTTEQLKFLQDSFTNPQSSLVNLRVQAERMYDRGQIEAKDYLGFLEKCHKLTHGEKIKHEVSGVVSKLDIKIVRVELKEDQL